MSQVNRRHSRWIVCDRIDSDTSKSSRPPDLPARELLCGEASGIASAVVALSLYC